MGEAQFFGGEFGEGAVGEAGLADVDVAPGAAQGVEVAGAGGEGGFVVGGEAGMAVQGGDERVDVGAGGGGQGQTARRGGVIPAGSGAARRRSARRGWRLPFWCGICPS